MNARNTFARVCSWILILALVLSMVPAVFAASETKTQNTDMVLDFDSWTTLDGNTGVSGDPVAV